jgi:hypothetical protein
MLLVSRRAIGLHFGFDLAGIHSYIRKNIEVSA